MTNLRLCFPPMEPQVNCMHSKLMLLFHKDYLRVVVPTANLTPFDWGEMGGVMENVNPPGLPNFVKRLTEQTVFLIDLPKRGDKSPEASKTAFYEDLVDFLQASTLHQNVIAKLESFDFSQTEHIAFVHTM